MQSDAYYMAYALFFDVSILEQWKRNKIARWFNSPNDRFLSLRLWFFQDADVIINKNMFSTSLNNCGSLSAHRRWVIRSIPHGRPIELFLLPASAA